MGTVNHRWSDVGLLGPASGPHLCSGSGVGLCAGIFRQLFEIGLTQILQMSQFGVRADLGLAVLPGIPDWRLFA